MQKFLKAHWTGLLCLAALAFLMCCDVEFTIQSRKVDAEGEFVITKSFGSTHGDIFLSAVGKQVEQEVEWRFHHPTLGSIWFDHLSSAGNENYHCPLWMLFLLTIGVMIVGALLPKPSPKPALASPVPEPAPPAKPDSTPPAA